MVYTGFTLIEMVLVLVVVSVIFVFGVSAMGRAFESFSVASLSANVGAQGRVAMERILRELREVRSASTTDLDMSAISTDPIYFRDRSGNPVCLALSGTTVQRAANAPGSASCSTNAQPLADNVVANGLNFYYYQSDGTAAASEANVVFITVTLQVTQDQVSKLYRSTVRLRRS